MNSPAPVTSHLVDSDFVHVASVSLLRPCSYVSLTPSVAFSSPSLSPAFLVPATISSCSPQGHQTCYILCQETFPLPPNCFSSGLPLLILDSSA